MIHECQEAGFSITKPHLMTGILSRAPETTRRGHCPNHSTRSQKSGKLQGAQQIHEVMCMGGLCSCMGFPPCHNQNYAVCQEILKEGGIHSPELYLQQSKFLPGENSHFGVWLQKDWKLSACCTTLYLRKIWERYKNLLSADV